VFGARPLKRVIQHRIQNLLALQLLEEDVGEGAVVRVMEPAAEGGEVRFEVVAPEAAEVRGG
jgi:ATP-dependent Clp protease ATP-binding subunit ClpA